MPSDTQINIQTGILTSVIYTILTSRFIPSGVVRENAAPNATSLHTSFAPSTVINLFIHALRGVLMFLRELPPVSLILCTFRRSTEVSPYLSYRSLFHHKNLYIIYYFYIIYIIYYSNE